LQTLVINYEVPDYRGRLSPLIRSVGQERISSVVELLFMGMSSVIQQTFNFIDVKIYYKNS